VVGVLDVSEEIGAAADPMQTPLSRDRGAEWLEFFRRRSSPAVDSRA